jgi:pSer/pThr/pTyr-binding forkhead associated (FHA) protein
VLHGGVAYPLEPGPFLVGCGLPEDGRGLDLPPGTPGVSKLHASLYRRDGRVVVEDRSRYGCSVNGERVETRTALAPGDRLTLGPSEVELLLIEVKD